jgi:hypothetical protein
MTFISTAADIDRIITVLVVSIDNATDVTRLA